MNTPIPSLVAPHRTFRRHLVSLASAVAVVLMSTAKIAAAETKWGDLFVAHVMTKWPDANTITHKGWEYENSIVLHGMEKIHKRGGDRRILQYIRAFADHYISEDGSVAM